MARPCMTCTRDGLMMRARILLLALLFPLVLATAAAGAKSEIPGDTPNSNKNEKPDKDKGLRPPPEAPGLRITLRPAANSPTRVIATFRNVTNQTIAIKNEFPGAIQRNASFARVFIDGKQTAAAGIYEKKVLVRDGSVILIKPSEERPLLEFNLFNLGTGNHTMYLSYSSQVFNYEKTQHNWWLGTSVSDTLSLRVRRADIEKSIVTKGNGIIKQILADLQALGKKYNALGGLGGTSLKRGKGVYDSINQIVYQTKPVSIVVQVRGLDEKLDPVPQFERKFPTLGVTLVCYFYGNDPVLRNAVFDAVRERAQEFNRLTEEVALQQVVEINKLSQDSMSLIKQADVIVKAQIKTAQPEVQDDMSTLFALEASPVRLFKGTPREKMLLVYTDNPTVRFKGAFVNRQFILYLDLKFADPETYTLLGADAVSAETENLIKETVGRAK